jgi:hypothetical protein
VEWWASGVKPIVNKFLERNYLFAVEFAEGFVFGRVVRRSIIQHKPYPAINTNGTPAVVPPLSSTAELQFRDPRNRDIDLLKLDTGTSQGYAWILHGAIGVQQPTVRVYLRYPSGGAISVPGRFPEMDPIAPGDDVSYISSTNSPYESPSDYAELIIPPRITVGVQYYNGDPATPVNPLLHLLFALYYFQPLDPSTDRELVSAIARRMVPAAFFTAGPVDQPFTLAGPTKSEWGVEPIPLKEAVKK